MPFCNSHFRQRAALCLLVLTGVTRFAAASESVNGTQPGASNGATIQLLPTGAALVTDDSAGQYLAQQPQSTLVPPAPSRTEPSRSATPQSSPPPQRPAAPSPAASPDFALEGATRSLGGSGAPTSTSAYMIGDFFVNGGTIFGPSDAAKQTRAVLGVLPNAGGSQRVKISENNSPIPRDRVFVAFNQFNNAIPIVQGTDTTAMDVSRYTPGFEKTFWNGQASIELRTPVAYTQNANVFLQGDGPSKRTEFGNLSVALKFLLLRTDNVAVAAGTGLNLPTAATTQVFLSDQPALTVKNQSTHLLPYIGAFWAMSERSYVQAFLQVDVDANGNAVSLPTGKLTGVINDQTLLYADVALGYWLYLNPEARVLTGIIPTIEFHYTTAMQNADFVAQAPGSQLSLGSTINRFDVTNVTGGTHFRFGPLSFLTVAGVFPLGSRPDQRQFDSEIVVQFNRLF